MKTYEEIVKDYKKRQHDTVVDTIATGLTYMDQIAVDTGLLEETGILTELTQSVTGILPFVIISATEGTKVLLGRKPGKTGLKDGAFRMAKTGAALGVGAAVGLAVGSGVFVPTRSPFVGSGVALENVGRKPVEDILPYSKDLEIR